MASEAKTITVEGAQIIFRNFSGKEGPYNREGEKSFCLVLTDELAQQMEADKWNVRYLEPREENEGDEPVPYVNVSVRFDIRPPRIYMLTDKSRTQLDEASVPVLDWAEIKNVDLIIRGSDWSVNGKIGVKAYLQSLFITIEEDELEKKYGIHDDDGVDIHG